MKGLFDWLDIFIIVWLWMSSIFMSNERILATGDIADFDFTVVKMEAQSIMRFWCRCQSIFENIGLWGSFAGGLHFNIWDPGDVLVKILAWSGSDGLTDGSTISSTLIDGKRFPVPATLVQAE